MCYVHLPAPTVEEVTVATTRSRTHGREHARPSSGGVAAEHATKIYTVALASIVVIVAFLALTSIGHVIDAATQHFMLFYAGVLALIALCGSVVFGLAATDRMFMNPGHRVFVQSAHRAASFGAVTFLIIHIVTEILAQRVHVLDAVIPFLSPFRTFYIGLGTIASDLIILLVITGIMRSRFNANGKAWRWRAIHYVSYVSFVFGVWHGLLGGRPGKPYVDWSYGFLVAFVAVGLAVKILSNSLRPKENLSSPPVAMAANSASAPMRAAAMFAQLGAARAAGQRDLVLSATSEPVLSAPVGAARTAAPMLTAPLPAGQALAGGGMRSPRYEPGYEGPPRYLGTPRDLSTGPQPRLQTGPLPLQTGPLPRAGSGPLPMAATGPMPWAGAGPMAALGSGPLPTNGPGFWPQTDDGSMSGWGSGHRPDAPTGPQPRMTTGSFPRPGTGPMPGAASGPMPRAGTGSFPRADSGPMPRSATGSQPRMPSGPYPRAGTGPMPRPGTGPMATDGGSQPWPAHDGPATRPFPRADSGPMPPSVTGWQPPVPADPYLRPRTGPMPRAGTGPNPRAAGGQQPRSASGPMQRPQTGPIQRPQTGPIQRPQTGPIQRPQTGPIQRPQTGPIQRPQTGPIQRPQTGPMPVASGPLHQSDFDTQSDFVGQPGWQGWPRGDMNYGGMNNAGMNNGGMNYGQAPWEGGFPEPDPDFMYREPGPGMPGYRGSRDNRYGGDVR
jgi:DMSO/TMAO reductase YedYZ heme-binding membrane subunit